MAIYMLFKQYTGLYESLFDVDAFDRIHFMTIDEKAYKLKSSMAER